MLISPEEERLSGSFAALRRDLLLEGGPQISTMGNYRFALLHYAPQAEFSLRNHVFTLTGELREQGWSVLSVALGPLMLARLRGSGEGTLQRLIEGERRLYAGAPERALHQLEQRLDRLLNQEDGLVNDVAAAIDAFARDEALDPQRTLIWLGRCGGLYPFVRTAALLKRLDGRTHRLPVVLLYPGHRQGRAGLSFLGELPADQDYRPRIY
jgi:hypothetical protein